MSKTRIPRTPKAAKRTIRRIVRDELAAQQPEPATPESLDLRSALQTIESLAHDAQEAMLDAPSEILELLAAGDDSARRLRALERLAGCIDRALSGSDAAMVLARNALGGAS